MIDYATYIGSPKNGGLRCTFVQISETMGVKFYRNANSRDESYRWQKELNRHGLAPAVGDKADITAPNGTKLYAHATEVARQVVSIDADEHECVCASMYDEEFAMLDGKEQMDFLSELKRFESEMEALGYSCTDEHPGNFGWIGDRLVLVDCEGMCREACSFKARNFPQD